jgi:hypothetical protein
MAAAAVWQIRPPDTLNTPIIRWTKELSDLVINLLRRQSHQFSTPGSCAIRAAGRFCDVPIIH